MRVVSSVFLAFCLAALIGCGGDQSQSGDTTGDTGQGQTMDTTTDDDAAGAAEQLVDFGNHNCPVCGMHAHGDDYAAYEGQKIHTCSAACAEAFAKDPEKYMAVLEGEAETEGEMPGE